MLVIYLSSYVSRGLAGRRAPPLQGDARGHPNAVNPDLGLRAEARSRGWPVYDFRSGRRATMIALPIAAGAGAVAGGVAAGAAVARRRAAAR